MWQFPTTLDDRGNIYQTALDKIRTAADDHLSEHFPLTAYNDGGLINQYLRQQLYVRMQQLALIDILKSTDKTLQIRLESSTINDDGSNVHFPFAHNIENDKLEICIRHIRRGYTYTKHIHEKNSACFNLNEIERQRGLEQALQNDKSHVIRIFKTENRLEIVTSKIDLKFIYKVMALYPIVFSEHFLPQNERTLCRDIINLVALGKNEAIDKCQRYVELNPLLKDYERTALIEALKKTRQTNIDNLARNRDALQSQYQQAENNAKIYFTRYIETQAQIELLQTTRDITQEQEEFIDYIYNHKYVKEIRPIGREGKVALNIFAPITNYEEEIVEHNYVKKGRWGADGTKALIALFLEDRFQLYTQSRITFNLITSDYARDTTAFPHDEEFYEQPHIHGFNCWGNHGEKIRARWKSGDMIGGFEQLLYATKNINFSDGTVINHFQSTLMNYHYRHSIWDSKENEFIDLLEMLIRYDKEKADEINKTNDLL